MHTSILSLAGLLAVCAGASIDPSTNQPTVVNVRIEGANHTIFERPVKTIGHSVHTASGGTHQCNGLNDNANPTPGPTCTSALDDASLSQQRFVWDGTFDTEFDDYFITSIGDSTQTATQFWGILLDFQFTPVGGCQQEVKAGQEVLWAFDAFNKEFFLKASGPQIASKGTPVTYQVIDGSTGAPVAGATIGGATTDSAGNAQVTFFEAGERVLKAEHPNGIRSNRVVTEIS